MCICVRAQFGETVTQLAVLREQPLVLDLLENWRNGSPVSLAGAQDTSGSDDDESDSDDTSDDESSVSD